MPPINSAKTIHPVLLSGGSGSRLWPLSRESYPKQFLPLVGEQTMLQDTVAARRGSAELRRRWWWRNEEHRFLVAEQLREIGVTPIGHPARAGRPQYRARRSPRPRIAGDPRRTPTPLLLVLPADHVIGDADAFRAAVDAAPQRGRRRARW